MKLYPLLPLFFQKIFWVPVRLVLNFFVHFEVKGLENLKEIKGRVIFTLNHPTAVDPMFLPAALPFWSRFSPIYGASREKEYYSGLGWASHLLGRWFFVIWGGYPVYAGLRDYEKSLPNHIALLQDEAALCFFPEGGRSPDGSIQPAKGGAAYLAERTDTPMVPVCLSGVYEMTFKKFFLRRGKIIVHFGKPIYQKEIKDAISRTVPIDPSIYKEEANYVMKKVGELLEK